MSDIKTNQFGDALLFILGEFAVAEDDHLEFGCMEVYGEDEQGREGSAEVTVNDLAQAAIDEVTHLREQLAKSNERVEELEKELASKELLHVGFTNGYQVKYAKTEEGTFYPDTCGDCYIPLYMLKSHEHRIETTSIEKLRKEQE